MKKVDNHFVSLQEFLGPEEYLYILKNIDAAIKTVDILDSYVRNNLYMQKKKDEYFDFSDSLFIFLKQLSLVNEQSLAEHSDNAISN